MSPFSVCFKIFDSDRDGVLSEAEVRVMVESMVEVRRQTAVADYLLPDEGGVDQMVAEILERHGGSGEERAVAQVKHRVSSNYQCAIQIYWQKKWRKIKLQISILLFSLCRAQIRHVSLFSSQITIVNPAHFQEEFLVWTVDNAYPAEFSRLVFHLCHVVLGLRPLTRHEFIFFSLSSGFLSSN